MADGGNGSGRPRTVALASSFARSLAPAAILDVVERSGLRALVLDASLDRDRLDAIGLDLEKRSGLAVLALEAPPAWVDDPPRLAAHDRAEADVALELTLGALRRAAALGAQTVVLRLSAPRALERDWVFARDRFVRGGLDAELARRLWQARDDVSEATLDGVRRGLDRLAREAERVGVGVALQHGRRYIEFPSVRELGLLLADCAGAPLYPALDLPAAHLLDLMELTPLAATVAVFTGPLIYVGDACGPVGALPPGRGLLDLPSLLSGLPKDAAWVFRPWTGLDEPEVLQGARGLAALA